MVLMSLEGLVSGQRDSRRRRLSVSKLVSAPALVRPWLLYPQPVSIRIVPVARYMSSALGWLHYNHFFAAK
jgi:hypothetical protein